MNRRDWLKSLVALAIYNRIPLKEVAAFAPLALALPVGYICELLAKDGSTVYIIKMDHGFEKLEGQAVSRERYPKLFEAIAEAYGKGDGSATFNLPDLRWYPPK